MERQRVSIDNRNNAEWPPKRTTQVMAEIWPKRGEANGEDSL